MSSKFVILIKCAKRLNEEYLIATDVASDEERDKLTKLLEEKWGIPSCNSHSVNLDWNDIQRSLEEATGYVFYPYKPDFVCRADCHRIYGSYYNPIRNIRGEMC